ncbi:hypothetical protein EVAR_98203_1 [Eumeta japonica]|uniref:Endonuclease-reverse transcriptase n=1 Tax=Eumeta variegata TaxID=151549 RepID=A0A4C1Y5L1_EUMVA|nr:hypothetical protein EVAR_98203_1 [Eumeta japonica]
MEEIIEALRNIQKELDEQKIAIRQNGEKVTEQVTLNINNLLEEKFRTFEEKHNNLKIQVENQEKRLYFLEKQARQRNIVFFGIEETETSYKNIEINMTKFIKTYFGLHLDPRDLQEIKRIGKKGERPRPITVTFSTLGTKIDILKKKGALKDTEYYVKEDYPQYILQKRKELREQLKIEKEKGNNAVIKYDKLIILDTKTNATSNNKRTFPISPDNSRPVQSITKKNKLQQTGPTITRSNSVPEGFIKPNMLNYLTNTSTTTTKTNNNQAKKNQQT